MIEPEFLEPGVVLFLHDQALREYGGMHGVKDDGLLQSALGLPVNKLAYAEPGTLDLFDLAAAYVYGITSNHAFNDANERTGWACCALFLKINGVDVAAGAIEVVDRMLLLVEGRLDEVDFAEWLRTSPRR